MIAFSKIVGFEVNPVTGSLQVFSVTEAEEAVARERKTREPGLLDAHDDGALLSFGIPQALLPSVRAVKTQDALLALDASLHPPPA